MEHNGKWNWSRHFPEQTWIINTLQTKWDWDTATISVSACSCNYAALYCSSWSLPLAWHLWWPPAKWQTQGIAIPTHALSSTSWIPLYSKIRWHPNPCVLNPGDLIRDPHFQPLWYSPPKENTQLTLLETFSSLLFVARPCHLDHRAISMTWPHWSNCP